MLIPERFIISHRNKVKESWDFFVLALAFQNSFIIPIDMAFEPNFGKSILY